MAALEKIKQSLRWRSAFAFYAWQRWLKTRGIPAIAWREIDPAAPILVSCVYAADVPLLRRCLESMHRENTRPPRALLVGDSPAAVSELKRYFSDGHGAVTIEYWENLLTTLPPEARGFCEAWRVGGPFGGYAKKFAVTLATNAREAMVMCDADVLFGGDFYAALGQLLREKDCIMAGEDYRASYDIKAAGWLGEERILAEKPLNCGVVYYPAGVLGSILSGDLLTGAMPLAAPADNHLEQTLIAWAFWKSGGRFFPGDMLETSLEDNLKWSKGLNGLARHYAGGKHLFWRDV